MDDFGRRIRRVTAAAARAEFAIVRQLSAQSLADLLIKNPVGLRILNRANRAALVGAIRKRIARSRPRPGRWELVLARVGRAIDRWRAGQRKTF
jgi:hypothetical protein